MQVQQTQNNETLNRIAARIKSISGSSYTEVAGDSEFMGDPVVSGNTGNVGANQPFDIIPPVFGVYVFIETV